MLFRLLLGALPFLKVASGNSTIPLYPQFRYVPFIEIEQPNANLTRTILGYDEATWDLPGTAEIETLDFCSILEIQQNVAFSLGFDGGWQWDCYINHYDFYDWEELEPEGVQEYFITLGWTAKSWEGKADAPESDEKFWSELNETEKVAVEQICYFEEIWDMNEAIPDWPMYSDAPSLAPSLRGTSIQPSTMAPSSGESASSASEEPSTLPTFAPTSGPSKQPSTMAPSSEESAGESSSSASEEPSTMPTSAPTSYCEL